MLLLSDNDAIVKTAQCRLLSALLECFEGDASYIVTPTFSHWFRNQMRRKRYPAYVEELITECDMEQVDDALVDEALVAQFVSPGIDAGEQILFAAACATNAALVYTGDKRAIECLYRQSTEANLLDKFRSKILCLEQAVLMIIRRHSFEFVRKRVQNALDDQIPLDSVLKASFGSGDLTTEDNAVFTLQAYVDELRNSTGEMLYRHDG